MNDEEIIKEMIDFIKLEERQIQARKLIGDSKAKNDVIEKTIKKLDKIIDESPVEDNDVN